MDHYRTWQRDLVKRVEAGQDVSIELLVGAGIIEAAAKLASRKEARELDQVTAARTDLSGSMGLNADHARVMELCESIVIRCRNCDLRTSVGGSIHADIAPIIIGRIGPHTLNTRHMVLDCEAVAAAPGECINRGLAFEAELYSYLGSIPSPRRSAHQKRAQIIANRIRKAAGLIPAVG